MTAPRRWKETPDAPVGVRELLSAGRGPRAIDGAAFDRGAARVAKLGAAPVAAAVAVGIWTKLAAAAVIGVAGIGAVVAVRHAGVVAVGEEKAQAQAQASAQAQAQASAAAQATANATVEAEAAAKAHAEAEAEATAKAREEAEARAKTHSGAFGVGSVAVATARVERAVEQEAAVASSPASTLGDELNLLEQARGALARDPTAALARIKEHRARFPVGALGAERDLIELDALRRSGRADEARARAYAWLAREPDGLHAARVRAILQSL